MNVKLANRPARILAVIAVFMVSLMTAVFAPLAYGLSNNDPQAEPQSDDEVDEVVPLDNTGVSVAITWAQETPATQASDQQFRYLASVSCSAVVGEICEAPVVTIPLPEDYPDAPGSTPIVDWNWSVLTGSGQPSVTLTVDKDAPALVLTVEDMKPGESTSISVRVTPSTEYATPSTDGTIPNNTSWTLQPTVSGDNFATVTAPQQTTSTATAEFNPEFSKKAPLNVLAGTKIEWSLYLSRYGLLFDPTFAPTIEDVIPENITLLDVVDDGGTSILYTYDPQTRLLTFEPEKVDFYGSFSYRAKIIAQLDEGKWHDGDIVENTATVSAKGIGENSPVELSSYELTNVVETVHFGNIFDKTSYGNVGLSEEYNGLNIFSAKQGRDAYYSLTVSSGNVEPFTPFNYIYEDQLPCFTGSSANLIKPLPSGSTCSDPAFLVSKLGFTSFDATGSPAPEVTVTFTDGSTDTFTPEGTESEWTPGYYNWDDWTVPAGKTVAKILVSGEERQQRYGTYVIVHGLPSDRVEDEVVIRNAMFADVSLPGETPVVPDSTDVYEDAIVLKDRYTASAYAPSPNFYDKDSGWYSLRFNADFSYTNYDEMNPLARYSILIPDIFDYSNRSWSFEPPNYVPVYTPIGIRNFEGSGMTLYQQTYNYSDEFISTDVPYGVYEYYVFAGYDGVDLKSCDTGLEGLPAEGNVLVPNGQKYIGGTGDGAVCMAKGTITITSPVPGFSIQKQASNNDGLWVSSPGTAIVSGDDLLGSYRVNWTNTGPTDLDNVVVYDLLPRIGDTGTVAGQSSTPRGSTTKAYLTDYPVAPGGWSAEWVFDSENPCRPELGVSTGCSGEWTTAKDISADRITAVRWTISSMASGASETFPLPVELTDAKSGQIAWNTAASYATLPNGSPLAPTESPKVGLGIPISVTPIEPELVPAEECDVESTITILGVPGVTYEQSREGTVVTITATADEGYYFPAGTTAGWIFDVAGEECPALPPAPPTMPSAGSLGFVIAPVLATTIGAILLTLRRNKRGAIGKTQPPKEAKRK